MPAEFRTDTWRPWVVGGFFGMLVLLGLLVHNDYGVSTDEPAHHMHGMVNVKYIADMVAPELARRQPQYARIPPLPGYFDNGHGVLFEIPVSLLSPLLAHGDSAVYYRIRHLLIFLVFVAGVWALYRLAALRFRSWRWGLVAASALVLSPRLFAEAFYNAQDGVFMALFAVAMYTMARLTQRPTTGRVLLHSVACAVAIDVRILGVMLVAFTLGWLSWQLVFPAEHGPKRRQMLLYTGLYLATTAVLVVAGWPFLWENPAGNFLYAFQRLSSYPWEGRNFYLGVLRPGSATPWHYAPVLIAITTPWPYLAAALGAWVIWLKNLLRTPRQLGSWAGQFDAVVVAWLLGPLLMVIALHSALYNGWRHLYFVYPALLLLGVGGVRAVINWARQRAERRWAQYVVAGSLLAGMLQTAYRMVRDHPQQQVYFSLIPPAVVARQFDRDYWGLSYRAGLEWLLAADSSARIRIGSPRSDLLYNNTLILPLAQRQRLQFVSPPYTAGTYVFTNYARYGLQASDTLGRKVYDLWVHDLPTLGIFRR
ncbi:hypothetical protein PK28_08025 [Hymenobacter sp. DG25B]|uniref:hypothetical protein n=1 Tax=Hymenobacter sp. DG25B TaxID=1385664 RepID=UPI00054095E7|nr:hypothetical protein [Hymenobacter sp. DG25B]AIZ63649.1 hypothetical protein PK28_08025 [Hymenobacter sp. DG25B]